jgi:hypothetical protein
MKEKAILKLKNVCLCIAAKFTPMLLLTIHYILYIYSVSIERARLKLQNRIKIQIL